MGGGKGRSSRARKDPVMRKQKMGDGKILQTPKNFINRSRVRSLKKYPPARCTRSNSRPLEVYNFRCEPYNNFFVNNILVHNCDTKYAWEQGRQISVDNLVSDILKLRGDVNMVVATGGEPLLQDSDLLSDLCAKLGSFRFKILIETNGTMEPSDRLLKVVDIWSISPKLRNSDQKVEYGDFDWLKNAKEWYLKFVVREPERDIRDIEEFLEKKNIDTPNVYLQPANEPGTSYLERSKNLAKYVLEKGVPFKVVPQLHVLLGLK
jgi:organic radical activating enzyme